jgi:hypothetical protein
VLLAESPSAFIGSSEGMRFEFDLPATGKARAVRIALEGLTVSGKRK